MFMSINLSVIEFERWKPAYFAVGSDCKNSWLKHAYCVYGLASPGTAIASTVRRRIGLLTVICRYERRLVCEDYVTVQR